MNFLFSDSAITKEDRFELWWNSTGKNLSCNNKELAKLAFCKGSVPSTIFIHIPKNGGTSIGLSLKCNRSHRKMSSYYSVLKSDLFLTDIFKFTFIRNPFDRLVSIFFFLNSHVYKNSLDVSKKFFNDWLQQKLIVEGAHNMMVEPQLSWVRLADGRIPLDYIARFENFKDEYVIISKKLGYVDPPKLLHANKGKHDNYRIYYDDKSIEIVNKVYAEDLKFFGYTFDNGNK